MAQLDGREVKAVPSPALILDLRQQKPGAQEHKVSIYARPVRSPPGSAGEAARV